MKLYLSCVAVFLLVATVSSHHAPGHPRPTTFGSKYVVYGDTKLTTCHGGKCTNPKWYQTQYYQNLHSRVQLRTDTNVRNVHENIFYQRSILSRRVHKYLLDASTNKCKVTLVPFVPILHVPASFSYHGTAYVEGKECGIWQQVTGGRGRPVIFKTWYVFWNAAAKPPRYEPVRYVSRIAITKFRRLSTVTKVTNWRGYSTGVSDSTLKIPSQCY